MWETQNILPTAKTCYGLVFNDENRDLPVIPEITMLIAKTDHKYTGTNAERGAKRQLPMLRYPQTEIIIGNDKRGKRGEADLYRRGRENLLEQGDTWNDPRSCSIYITVKPSLAVSKISLL